MTGEIHVRADADQVICLYKPVDFFAVGQFYDSFDQTIDREVVELLRRASERAAAVSAAEAPEAVGQAVAAAGGVAVAVTASASADHSCRSQPANR